MEKNSKRIYWLDGFNGPAAGGFYYRSSMAVDIDTFETKFSRKVVAVEIESKHDSEKPSWNVNMICEATEQDIKEAEERRLAQEELESD